MTCWPWRAEMADAAVLAFMPPLLTLSEAAVLAVAACSRTDSRRCVVTRQSFPRSAPASFHVWAQRASGGGPLGALVLVSDVIVPSFSFCLMLGTVLTSTSRPCRAVAVEFTPIGALSAGVPHGVLCAA